MKTRDDIIMMFSNLFLVLPVIFSFIYNERLYLFFATGIFIFSVLYHWFKIVNVSSVYFRIFEWLDVLFGIGSFSYMYYYVYKYSHEQDKLVLYVLLSLAILFFLWGRRKNYKLLHPWFHVVAPAVSSTILVLAHLS